MGAELGRAARGCWLGVFPSTSVLYSIDIRNHDRGPMISSTRPKERRSRRVAQGGMRVPRGFCVVLCMAACTLPGGGHSGTVERGLRACDLTWSEIGRRRGEVRTPTARERSDSAAAQSTATENGRKKPKDVTVLGRCPCLFGGRCAGATGIRPCARLRGGNGREDVFGRGMGLRGGQAIGVSTVELGGGWNFPSATPARDGPTPGSLHHRSEMSEPFETGTTSSPDELLSFGEMQQPFQTYADTGDGEHNLVCSDALSSAKPGRVVAVSVENATANGRRGPRKTPQARRQTVRRTHHMMPEGKPTRKMEYIDKMWDAKFEELKRYKAAHGHCNVPYKGQYGALGRWVTTQRTFYKQGLIPLDRIASLEGVGFDWDLHVRLWELHFEQLLLFRMHKGHTVVPYRYRRSLEKYDTKRRGPTSSCNINDLDLGAWVNNQRAHMRVGRVARERVERLKAVGFIFEVTDCGWKCMFLRLCLFKQRFGHAEVPMEKEDGDMEGGANQKELRTWQHIQRTAYARGKMAKVRRDALEAVGFKWQHAGRPTWSEMLEEVVSLRSPGGRSKGSAQALSDAKLERWLKRQVVMYQNGRLSHAKAEKLSNKDLVPSSKSPPYRYRYR